MKKERDRRLYTAIAGTNGAGKSDVLANFLKENGFTIFSISDQIDIYAQERGVKIRNRKDFQTFANSVRKEKGKGGNFFLKLSIEEAVRKKVGRACFESIRCLAEVSLLRMRRISLVAVDADPRIRYDRCMKRKSKKDFVTFEEFVEQEKAEQSPDFHQLNIPAVIEKAGHVFLNNGTREEMERQIARHFRLDARQLLLF